MGSDRSNIEIWVYHEVLGSPLGAPQRSASSTDGWGNWFEHAQNVVQQAPWKLFQHEPLWKLTFFEALSSRGERIGLEFQLQHTVHTHIRLCLKLSKIGGHNGLDMS